MNFTTVYTLLSTDWTKRGVIFGIDTKNMLYVLYREFSVTRKTQRNHVAKSTGKAIPSPYVAGLVPAFA